MLLRGRHGTELGLAIIGYEHPHEHVDPWESNSLLVEVRILAPEGSWDVVDPCLTTWEAARLAGWLATLATRPDVAGGRLAEPNVTFTAAPAATSGERGERHLLAVRAAFALERRPPWLSRSHLSVEVEVDRPQLAAAARQLKADLIRFPLRGDDPTL